MYFVQIIIYLYLIGKPLFFYF